MITFYSITVDRILFIDMKDILFSHLQAYKQQT